MKHSFLRLISSFYILLISALMIVISAYAWMVISDSPAAGGIGFGIAGLEKWNIPEAKEPEEYDFMDGIRLTAADVVNFAKDNNDAYIIDSAEKFVAIMEYIDGNTELQGNISMVLTKNISLETHDMAPVLKENGETVIPVWNAGDWNPVEVKGYTGTGRVHIQVDPALTESTEFTTAYIKGLSKPLCSGGFAGDSGIIISDITIFGSSIESTNTLGSGAFIECVDRRGDETPLGHHSIL